MSKPIITSIGYDRHHEGTQYLDRCAKLRKISVSSLVRRMLDIITTEHLVAAILDDADSMHRRRLGERKYKPFAITDLS